VKPRTNVRDVWGLYLSLRRALLPKLEAQQNALGAAGFTTLIVRQPIT
jgi:hypothetical protein